MTHRLTQAGCVCVLRTESDNMQNFFSTLSAEGQPTSLLLTHTHIWELVSLTMRTH